MSGRHTFLPLQGRGRRLWGGDCATTEEARQRANKTTKNFGPHPCARKIEGVEPLTKEDSLPDERRRSTISVREIDS